MPFFALMLSSLAMASEQKAPGTATLFRSAARGMYEDLLMRSCDTPAGYDRDAILGPDRDKVASLEQSLSTTDAGAHLAIAREDVIYKFAAETHCWADDTLAFAKIHAGMIHESVSANSAEMRKLAPAVEPLAFAPTAANAAAFRYKVRELVEWTLPYCSYTTKGSNDAIFAEARAQVKSFADRLRGTPYEVHFAIARDDAIYDRSRRTAECDDPENDSIATLGAQMSESARKRIKKLEELAVLK